MKTDAEVNQILGRPADHVVTDADRTAATTNAFSEGAAGGLTDDDVNKRLWRKLGTPVTADDRIVAEGLAKESGADEQAKSSEFSGPRGWFRNDAEWILREMHLMQSGVLVADRETQNPIDA